jgi:ABC-type transport system involved in cytochrome c biogenesis permease subunit
MKKWIPWILVGLFGAWVISGVRPQKAVEGFNVAEFAKLPVLLNGRIQPFDSVARNSLLSMSGKSVVRTEDKKTLSPTEWLLEVMTRPDNADTRKIFRVQHPDLETMLGTDEIGLKTYAFNDITNHLEKVEEQARQIRSAEEAKKSDSQTRTAFQKDLMHLYDSLILYHRIKNTLGPEGTTDFSREVAIYQESIAPGLAALQSSQKKEEYDSSDLQVMAAFFRRYQNISKSAYALVIPPAKDEPRDGWDNIGDSLMESMRSEGVHPAVTNLAAIAATYSKKQPVEFNQAVVGYKAWLQANNFVPELKKGREEYLFNQAQPFYKAMVIYVAALLLGCVFWMNLAEPIRRTAFYLLVLGFLVHTAGLISRMYLEGRPPVTNLYSSAIFVGWAAVLLCMILERIFKGGIGLVAAGFIGFVTLIIAHHLSLSGDTMEMLRAVLDTNFWLATHVVVITAGYSAMFVAGLLAIIYVVRGFFTSNLGVDTAKALSRMVYGIVCFATLCSFVGTILGGIWADQSWGRFWGWDPKENGALLIVIWCAIMLHARWGKLVGERGLMAMAIFGNIVTSFSWFGVNMLGIGLHSYGFMDAAFFWLMLFIASQALIIALCFLPTRLWGSFRKLENNSPGSPAAGAPQPVSADA